MSVRKKPRPTPAPTWDAALDALVCAHARDLAMDVGLLLVLRAQVPDHASPADVTARDARAFLAALPRPLVPAGRETLDALRALARAR